MKDESVGRGLVVLASALFVGTIAVKLGSSIGEELSEWVVDRGKKKLAKLTQSWNKKKENS